MSQLRIHDHFQLELKRDIPIDAPGPSTLELWFWVPGQLGLDEPVFHKEAFYRDLTAYVRFHTPRMPRDAILERIGAFQARLAALSGTAADPVALERDLRLFAAMFRAVQRDGTRASMPRETHAADALARHVSTGRDALRRFRDLRATGATAPAPWPSTLAALEDYLSQQAIEGWYALLAAWADQDPGVAASLRDAIRAETAARADGGLQGTLDPADDAQHERFVTRMNALKKFVLAVLHVRLEHSRRTQHVQDLLFGLAAALAMLVAVSLQLWTMWTVGVPTGPGSGPALFTFVTTAVGGYILKDRMKEWLKGWFAQGIPRWLHDRRIDLVSEAGPLGSVEETVRLLRPSETPPDVAALRSLGEEALTASERDREDIIHYRRSAWLRRDGAPAEMDAVDEILRFHVQRWLRRMDEPTRALSQVQHDGTVARIRAAKVYMVTAIVRDAGRLARYNVVLNRKGLLRVERVPAGPARA
ncbi:MAG: hypothetical protein RLZZ299_2891 [Pseudomonadota bacterium]